jgi:hypothetical protein
VIAIAEGVRAKAKVAKVPDTRQDMYDFFVKQVGRTPRSTACVHSVPAVAGMHYLGRARGTLIVRSIRS